MSVVVLTKLYISFSPDVTARSCALPPIVPKVLETRDPVHK